MLAIPDNVLARFNEVLKQRAVHESFHIYYRKWLRYFLDLCEKHPPPDSKSEQVRLFAEKLKSKYLPVVLSRPAVDTIIRHTEYPYDIVISLLYGCGLRLVECLSLRVQNFNFEDGILTVHGKGDKDRTVPLPQSLIPKLKNQLAVVSELHKGQVFA